MRRPADPRERRNKVLLAVLIVCAAAALLAVVVEAAGSGGSSVARGTSRASALPGELTGPAPWPSNIVALRARLQALGLPALPREGTVLHIHTHLDVYVDGRHVTVPAGIGINEREGFISPLHTHDDSGVIHVESTEERVFTLGEFFGVWGVQLTRSCLGDYCAKDGKSVWVFLDGRRVAGDPPALALNSHEEIVIAYGTRAQLPHPIPATYDFARGL